MNELSESLAGGRRHWSLLAIDHGLTDSSDAVPAARVPQLLQDCSTELGAAVLTYGLARSVRRAESVPVVVQCVGAPFGLRKVQVCTVADVLRVGGVGISVQINFGLDAESLEQQIETVGRLVGHAHSEGLPVLFMISPKAIDSLHDFEFPIRVCHELGADLVKVSCNPKHLSSILDDEQIRGALDGAPPVVLAGGAVRGDLLPQLQKARDIGFSGFCIGRNIFNNPAPANLIKQLNSIWYDTDSNEVL